jgi:predicted Zn-dependent peptidase
VKRAGLLCALMLCAACETATTAPPLTPTPPVTGNRPPAAAAAEDFRKKPPPAGPEAPYVAPNVQEAKLGNGVRVLIVERHDLPIVAVQFVVDRGAAQDKPGVGAFAGSMLTSGTKTRKALALSDELDQLGAEYAAWVGYDASVVQGECLKPKLGRMLDVLADVVQNPSFAQDELERERSRRLTALAQENDRPAALLANTVGTELYPAAHPYSSSLLATEAALKAVQRADLVRFHKNAFAPDSTTVVFAGDVSKAEAVAEAERVLGKWQGKAAKVNAVAEPPAGASKGPRVVIVDRPGASQSNVAVALPGVPRQNPDFEAILVMNTIFGGMFSSRLNLNLREKHAYTYGARSGFEMRQGPGPFSAGGAVFREKTDAALKEILTEMERIRAGMVSEEELAAAKSNLVKQLPGRFETAEETAATIGGLPVYKLPLDEFTNRPARVQKVTREDVQRVAQKYLVADRVKVVAVGDAATIRAGLGVLGLGEAEVRQPPGKPPAPAAKAAGKTDGKTEGKPDGKAAPAKPDGATGAPKPGSTPKPSGGPAAPPSPASGSKPAGSTTK